MTVQEWPGIFTEKSWTKFKNMLEDSLEKGKNTVIFCHVPANGFGGKKPARLPEFKRMLSLIEGYPNVRAYIAGHCHGGDIAVRRGILHKTVKSVCDHSKPTACIFEVDENKIDVCGIGEEKDYTHYFEETTSRIRGTAPADNVKIEFKSNPKRKLYHGTTDGYALLHITDSGKPVRWFDIACNEYGAIEPEVKKWHEHSRNYWTKGEYAFTAEGEVVIRKVPLHSELAAIGWYKGDLHAHLIHGEKIYKGNVQQSAFIGRAEGYNWLYMAEDYWFMLLNSGYEIGCFATSDAAFDVGRTPGSDRGATYLYMNNLNEENIKKAILEKRSVVTWDSAVVLFDIDGCISGDRINADGGEHILKVKVLWQADRKGILRIVRNGTDIERIPVEFNGDEQQFEFKITVSETENCWYAVMLEAEDGKIRSVASPVYFRNESFVAPKVIEFKEPFPEELLAECEELTPEQLAKPGLLDEFAEKLLRYSEGF